MSDHDSGLHQNESSSGHKKRRCLAHSAGLDLMTVIADTAEHYSLPPGVPWTRRHHPHPDSRRTRLGSGNTRQGRSSCSSPHQLRGG